MIPIVLAAAGTSMMLLRVNLLSALYATLGSLTVVMWWCIVLPNWDDGLGRVVVGLSHYGDELTKSGAQIIAVCVMFVASILGCGYALFVGVSSN